MVIAVIKSTEVVFLCKMQNTARCMLEKYNPRNVLCAHTYLKPHCVLCTCVCVAILHVRDRMWDRAREIDRTWKCTTRKKNCWGMNRYTARQLQMSGPVRWGWRGGGREWLADPGRSPIDSVAMGTGVSPKMKGTGGWKLCVCVCVCVS